MIGIYGIEIGGKWYVGSSVNVNHRIHTHELQLKNKRHAYKSLNVAIKKHKKYEIKVLMELKDSVTLKNYETYFMGYYDSVNNGYNEVFASYGEDRLLHKEYRRVLNKLCVRYINAINKTIQVADGRAKRMLLDITSELNRSLRTDLFEILGEEE